MEAYVDRLTRFVFRSGLIMKPIFSAARDAVAKRVIYADGEDERVLRAAQVVIEEGIAKPILIGRPHVIDVRTRRYGLKIKAGRDFELINPEDDPRYRQYVESTSNMPGGAASRLRPRARLSEQTLRSLRRWL
jgi:malate dehydrogenase (oxaloacetate-decarboxylating)(NADP+)